MTEHAHGAFIENTKFRMMEKQTSLKKHILQHMSYFQLT
jgi:hypothetical protein